MSERHGFYISSKSRFFSCFVLPAFNCAKNSQNEYSKSQALYKTTFFFLNNDSLFRIKEQGCHIYSQTALNSGFQSHRCPFYHKMADLMPDLQRGCLTQQSPLHRFSCLDNFTPVISHVFVRVASLALHKPVNTFIGFRCYKSRFRETQCNKTDRPT